MTGIDVDVTDDVGTITVSNPEKRNAIAPSFLPELTDGLATLRDDVRCLVITGAGEEAFCSGFDLSALDDGTFHEDHEDAYEEAMTAVATFPYPTVAKVNGDAIGGGLDLCVSCDLRIAATTARFASPTARIGIVYTERAIRQLVHAVGPSRTKELLFTANVVDASWADDAGLLADVVDPEALDERTERLTSNIAGNAPRSLTASKQIVQTILDADRLTPAERTLVERLRTAAFESDDFEEGRAAISEGREPTFTGE